PLHRHCPRVGGKAPCGGKDRETRMDRDNRLCQRFLSSFGAGWNDLFRHFRRKTVGPEPKWFSKMAISSRLGNQVVTSIGTERHVVFWMPGPQIVRSRAGR